MPAQTSAAQTADAGWLRLLDAGQYAASWRAAAKSFQMAISPEDWEKAVRRARAPLGAVTSRTLAESRHTTTLAGAPDGEYMVSVFATSFEHKASARETVTAAQQADGSWRVAGYYIK